MGVYVFRSKHMDAIKIGHYCNLNAWSRIAHRGFYSCKCPDQIKEKVSVDDLVLQYWFPNLTSTDEKNILKSLSSDRICGEWFSIHALGKINNLIGDENKAHECSKENAIMTRKRL